VVLHEPEIPNNTGNIGRTCIATASALHLIRPLGFDTSEKACRRAGLDYWPRLRPTEHASLDDYLAAAGSPADDRLFLLTTRTTRPLWSARFSPGDHLIFGKETRGLPEPVERRFAHRLFCLPMAPGERSLNLATAVCAVVYEALRQFTERGQVSLRPDARLDLPGASPAARPAPGGSDVDSADDPP
jgi:tRNA (cytidine/uridine-2'-O-)-methyltransferase